MSEIDTTTERKAWSNVCRAGMWRECQYAEEMVPHYLDELDIRQSESKSLQYKSDKYLAAIELHKQTISQQDAEIARLRAENQRLLLRHNALQDDVACVIQSIDDQLDRMGEFAPLGMCRLKLRTALANSQHTEKGEPRAAAAESDVGRVDSA